MRVFIFILNFILNLIIFFIQLPFLNAQKGPVYKAPFPARALEKGGILFALPKVRFRFEVDIRIVEKRRGVYSPFTSKYFDVTDYIKSDSREYYIKQIRLNTVSIADEEQLYFLSAKDLKGISIQVDEKGIIRNLNANTNYDVKAKAFVPSEVRLPIETPALSQNIQPRFGFKADTVINREFTRDSTIIERRYVTKKLVERSLEDYAREAFDKLQDIRKRRYDFLSDPSELNLDGAGLTLLLNELDKMEKRILELFFGYVTYSDKTLVFEYEPSAELEQPLFNFTRDKGIQFNTKSVRGIETVVMKFTPSKGQLQPFTASMALLKSNSKKRRAYIPYRVPLHAHIRLVQDETVFLEADVVIPQQGEIGKLYVKDLRKIRVTYDPSTGALLTADFVR
ncbi:MAG: DUF4831 family protein [Flavobacteriales bacterium]|nr:DUF4831 family protein [Flavobacteriales bacterium]MDW8409151.1 DUF4831 family protein [Flavobacteriales bacterium]